MAGMWHTILFVCHVVAWVLAFSLGIFLITRQNSLFTVLTILKSIREDYVVGPVDHRILDENDTSEVTLKTVRSCLLICGAISLVLSILIVANVYCFLALILSPGTFLMNWLPGLQTIRSKMEWEVSGAKPPPSVTGGFTPPPPSNVGSTGTPVGSVPGSTGTPAS